METETFTSCRKDDQPRVEERRGNYRLQDGSSDVENHVNTDNIIGLSREARILRVKKIVLEHFKEHHWKEMGSDIGCSDLLAVHDQPLGSIGWGDDAYAATVLSVLAAIVHRNPSDLERLELCAEKCLAQVEAGSFTGVTLTRT